jgi:hypothetical protein
MRTFPTDQSVRDRFLLAKPRCPKCRTRSPRMLAYFDPDAGAWLRLSDGAPTALFHPCPADPDLTLRCLGQGRAHYDSWGEMFVPESLQRLYQERAAARWERLEVEASADGSGESVEAAEDVDARRLWWADEEFAKDLEWLPLAG